MSIHQISQKINLTQIENQAEKMRADTGPFYKTASNISHNYINYYNSDSDNSKRKTEFITAFCQNGY